MDNQEILTSPETELIKQMFSSILNSLITNPKSPKLQLQIDIIINEFNDLIISSGFDINLIKGLMYNLDQKMLNRLYAAILKAKRHS